MNGCSTIAPDEPEPGNAERMALPGRPSQSLREGRAAS